MPGRNLTTCVVRKAWDHSVPTRRKAEVGQQRVFEGGMGGGRGEGGMVIGREMGEALHPRVEAT